MKIQAGQAAFITGGASGIGLGMAQAFGRRGMKIMIADIEPGALASAIERLGGEGIEADGVVLDVADREAVNAAAAQAIARCGKIHLVCNNAGVVVADPLGAIAERDWDWIVDVNFKAVVYGTEAFVPHMRAHGEGGHFVNTASIAGLLGYPGFSAYAATKFAVVGLTEAWRLQFEGEPIGFSVLSPGATATNIFDSRRNQQVVYGGEGAGSRGEATDRATVAGGLAPEIVGAHVLESVEADELYILTHDAFRPIVEMTMQRVMDGFEATRTGQAMGRLPEMPLPNFF